jgi:hypothetical protein
MDIVTGSVIVDLIELQAAVGLILLAVIVEIVATAFWRDRHTHPRQRRIDDGGR